jgi:membrane dipeptidase
MIDLSHLNTAGFWDVAKHSTKPLVATHSNAHAICPHSRNLTDDQLKAIRDSDGMVGLNFAVAFLRADGRMLPDVALEQMLRHLDHLIEHLGEDRVGLGSDYDGAVVPAELTTCAGLPALRAAMADHGYGDDLIVKICHENWFRVLEKTWGA